MPDAVQPGAERPDGRRLRDIPWTPGKEFEVVTISIDPRESFDLAQQKKRALPGELRKAGARLALPDRLLTGNAKKLADQSDFTIAGTIRLQQFAHAAAIMVLTPDGKVARYLYGIRSRRAICGLALDGGVGGQAGNSGSRSCCCSASTTIPHARGYALFATQHHARRRHD